MKLGDFKIITEPEINYLFDKNNKPYAIIKRKKGKMETDICPFCKGTHIHGTLAGHRVAHCTYEKKNDSVQLRNGIILYREDGYFIKNY